MVIRVGKTLMLLSVSSFFLLVTLNNLLDYKTNFLYVQHVLRMDSTFQVPILMTRAIENPVVHHLFYWIIIAWEGLTGILCLVGSFKLFKNRFSSALTFNSVKQTGILGLICGFSLYSFAFITIGGEWFAMWQSKIWNGKNSSHVFMTMIGVVLLTLIMKDE